MPASCCWERWMKNWFHDHMKNVEIASEDLKIFESVRSVIQLIFDIISSWILAIEKCWKSFDWIFWEAFIIKESGIDSYSDSLTFLAKRFWMGFRSDHWNLYISSKISLDWIQGDCPVDIILNVSKHCWQEKYQFIVVRYNPNKQSRLSQHILILTVTPGDYKWSDLRCMLRTPVCDEISSNLEQRPGPINDHT